jgi:hypothetical protein
MQDLVEILCDLSDEDQLFACSLASYWFERLRLTEKQWTWVHKLIEKGRSEAPGNLVVLSLTRHVGLITDVAARLRELRGAARRAFIRDTIKEHEDCLVAVGVPRNLARRDARALVAAAEAALAPPNKGGSAA